MISTNTFLAILLNPLWFFLSHVVLNRLSFFRKFPPQRRLLLISCATLGGLFLLLALFEGHSFYGHITPLLYFFSFTLLGMHLYFHIFNMSETARRIHIIVSIKKNGSLPKSAYSPTSIAANRLARLRSLNQTREAEGKIYARPGPLLFAAFILKRIERLLFPDRF